MHAMIPPAPCRSDALLQQALQKALGIGYADPKKTFDSNPQRLPFRGHAFDSEHAFDTNPQRLSLRGHSAQDGKANP